MQVLVNRVYFNCCVVEIIGMSGQLSAANILFLVILMILSVKIHPVNSNKRFKVFWDNPKN